MTLPLSKEMQERDRKAERLMERATELYVVFRRMTNYERARRLRDDDGGPSPFDFEPVCWVETQDEAERIVHALKHGHRTAPTLVPRGAWERGHSYGWRAVSANVPPGVGLQGVLELAERLADAWARRAALLECDARNG